MSHLIFLNKKKAAQQPNIVHINTSTIIAIAFATIACIAALLIVSFNLGVKSSPQHKQMQTLWQASVDQQTEELNTLKTNAKNHLNALSQQLGQIQARITRTDALGQRIIKLAKLNSDEFNFKKPPAIGGTENTLTNQQNTTSPHIEELITQIEKELNNKSTQLLILEKVLIRDNLKKEIKLSGMPVTKGWLSSQFGKRIDPFNGKNAWHQGVDIAGKLKTPIIATGAGVIIWSGKRHNYGKMVEIDHGNGLTSRYAHNLENLVKVGQVVNKGDKLALMGSSGRSTGPHVHYEVLKKSRPIDPQKYLR